eukprot:5417794-Pyramimonas_sp.AAC.1
MDYAIVSEAALPYILSLQPQLDVPWRPRIGPSLNLRRSGQQLQTRRLVHASRSPQVARPRTLPAAGSKSSVAKHSRRLQQEVSRVARNEKIVQLFGDHAGVPSASQQAEPRSTDQASHELQSAQFVDLEAEAGPDEEGDPQADPANFASAESASKSEASSVIRVAAPRDCNTAS